MIRMLLVVMLFLGLDRAQDPVPPKGQAPEVSIEDEVLANVKAQAVGAATVADLALPEEFLRRVAGRVIRASFEERYRIVVPDPKPDAAQSEAAKPPSGEPPKTTAPGSSAAKDGGWSTELIVGTVALAGFLALVLFGRKAKETLR